MKLTSLSLLALSATVLNARFIETTETNQAIISDYADEQRYLIELSPGETRWVTEEEKWELRRNGQNFMDITYTPKLGAYHAAPLKKPVFPTKVAYEKDVKSLLTMLDKGNMQKNLEHLTSYHTRYYKSSYGAESSKWILSTVQALIKDAEADKYGVSAVHFPHPWGQNSVIVTIPGQTNKTVVIGAHQDSINLFLPSIFSAPGADDDGSGSVTIIEALRVLLTSKNITSAKAENTIEFHWYSAEEGGLLGSQAIFQDYEKKGKDVRAMLQQDMTGYVQGTLDVGKEEAVGVITDFVDADLTEFIKVVIRSYCTIPYVLTKCGYACSDHASASKAGYPSAFVIESAFGDSNKKIHTSDDLIKYLSFDHMLQHAQLTLGLVFELAWADL